MDIKRKAWAIIGPMQVGNKVVPKLYRTKAIAMKRRKGMGKEYEVKRVWVNVRDYSITVRAHSHFYK